MSKVYKRIIVCLNLAFSIVFIGHLSYIIDGILNPELPEVEVSKQNLSELEFPLLFRICVSELSNISRRYERVGYDDYWELFRGLSSYNSSLFGWNGFREDGTTFGTVEGQIKSCSVEDLKQSILEVLKEVSFNWSSIINAVEF